MHCKLRILEYRKQNTDYRLQITDYKLQNTNYGIQITDYRQLLRIRKQIYPVTIHISNSSQFCFSHELYNKLELKSFKILIFTSYLL